MAKKSEGGGLEKARRFVTDMRESAVKLSIAAEVVLRGIEDRHDPGYSPVLSPDDEALLGAAGFSALVEDQGQLKQELSRIARERDVRQAAGPATKFEAALAALEAAEVAETNRGAELDQEIERLQQERAKIFDQLADATTVVETMTSARSRMRSLAPRFVQQQVDFAKRSAHLQQAPVVTALEGRVEAIERILQLDGRDTGQTIVWLESQGREDLVVRDHAGHRAVDIAGLEAWKESLDAELPGVERELADKRAEYGEAMRMAEQPLDRFVEAAIESASWPEQWLAEADAAAL